MRLLRTASLAFLIPFFALAGCSSPGAPLGASGVPSSVSAAPARDAGHGTIYASSFGGNTVDYYLKSSGPSYPVAGSLSGSLDNPWGMAVDANDDVYVANSEDENVLVYAKGSTSPTSTLEDPNKFPCDVALGSDGTVYVANGSGTMFSAGNVVIYEKGASEPTQTLNNSHFYHVAGLALDKAGNLFVSYNVFGPSKTGGVVEFKAPGFTHTANMHVKLGYAGGVGFDSAGHLLVVDQKVPSLNVYTVGKRKPIATLSLPGTSWFFAFNKNSTRLYVADSQLGEIDIFDYTPTALTQVGKITSGLSPSNDDFGVADTPPQQL
jgi:hypothetical protein